MLLHGVATVAAKRCCSKLQSVAPALQLLSMDNGAHASASTKRTEGSAPFERGSNLGIDSTDQRGRRLLDWRRQASRLRASTLINRPEGRRAGISARPRREHDDRHAGNSDAGTNEIPSRELGAVNEPQRRLQRRRRHRRASALHRAIARSGSARSTSPTNSIIGDSATHRRHESSLLRTAQRAPSAEVSPGRP